MPDRIPRPGRRVSAARLDFPSYTAAENTADRLVHLVGLAAATAAIVWLFARVGPGATGKQLAALSIYCCGLVGMLSASAVYNQARPSRLKAGLRRLDQSMIFVMIAGSYTPFAISALRPELGLPLCALVWGLAAVGVAVRLACRSGCELASLALYLGMGWLGLAVLRPLSAVVPGAVLLLLFVGGLIYSLGVVVQAQARMPFQNAIWHAMVVAAAALHFAAVAQLSSGPR